MLAEDHNLPAKTPPALEAGLSKVGALRPDHLIFSYGPRPIEDPERNMPAVERARALRRRWPRREPAARRLAYFMGSRNSTDGIHATKRDREATPGAMPPGKVMSMR